QPERSATNLSTRVWRGFPASSSRRKSRGFLDPTAASSSMELSIAKQFGAWLTDRRYPTSMPISCRVYLKSKLDTAYGKFCTYSITESNGFLLVGSNRAVIDGLVIRSAHA